MFICMEYMHNMALQKGISETYGFSFFDIVAERMNQKLFRMYDKVIKMMYDKVVKMK